MRTKHEQTETPPATETVKLIHQMQNVRREKAEAPSEPPLLCYCRIVPFGLPGGGREAPDLRPGTRGVAVVGLHSPVIPPTGR